MIETPGYLTSAMINGKRSVCISLLRKRKDASTWDVVQRVKAALPDMQGRHRMTSGVLCFLISPAMWSMPRASRLKAACALLAG